MESITVRNYRCFGERSQTAWLAPLTLFVGENSSGKTSLLAMIRALWDTAFADRIPDFKEEPYDLGTFDEILHHPAAGASRATSFTVSCEVLPSEADDAEHDLVLFSAGDEAGHGPFKTEVEFESQWSAPMPIRRRIARGEYWIEQRFSEGGWQYLRFGVSQNIWKIKKSYVVRFGQPGRTQEWIPPLPILLQYVLLDSSEDQLGEFPDRIEESLSAQTRLRSNPTPLKPAEVHGCAGLSDDGVGLGCGGTRGLSGGGVFCVAVL